MDLDELPEMLQVGEAAAVLRIGRTAAYAILASKVQDPTGKWLALDARFLKRQQFTISWIYDAALRTELTARLGYDWEPLKDDGGQSDLVVIPEEVREMSPSAPPRWRPSTPS